MATATTTPYKSFIYFQTTRLSPSQNTLSPSFLSFPKYPTLRRHPHPVLYASAATPFSRPLSTTFTSASAAAADVTTTEVTTFHGPCFVVGDNIDTDQIIPAEYLTLVPSKPDEYRKLGTFAFSGLPSAAYPTLFIDSDSGVTRYPIIIAGDNFGCGSSREHAPVALGAAGACAVIAESYARIFFRNCVATGEIYPLESEETGICKECTTGDIVTVDLRGNCFTNHTTGKTYKLKPIGDVGPVIEAGGIFAYARNRGMIPSAS